MVNIPPVDCSVDTLKYKTVLASEFQVHALLVLPTHFASVEHPAWESTARVDKSVEFRPTS